MQRRVNTTPRFYIFIIAFMLVSFAASFAVSQIHYSRVSKRVASLASERIALTNRVSELTAQLDYVRTDAYIERVARDELNLIMPGEIRYVAH